MNRPTPDHTFVIPAYGRSEFLEACIRSLLCQTLKSRIIIATSTPSAFLSRLCRKYNLTLMVNDRCRGIAADWNFAFDVCQTPYLTLAHQDDVYHPEYARDCVETARNDPQTQIVFTDYGEIQKDGRKRTGINYGVKKILLSVFFGFSSRLSRPLIKRLFLSFGNPISCPGVMFNKTQLPNFKFPGQYAINLDWAAWITLAGQKGRFSYINRPLFYHRIHPEAESAKGLKDSRRRREDETLMRLCWPKPLATVLLLFYALSRRSVS